MSDTETAVRDDGVTKLTELICLFDGSGNGGFDADVSAKIAGVSLGDGTVLPILGDCGLLGAELPGLASLDLPDLDLCSLTQQIGL